MNDAQKPSVKGPGPPRIPAPVPPHGTPPPVPHVAEPEEIMRSATLAGAPHIAEKEHVVSAQILTKKSPTGDTTIMVERERGKAMHATVIDEKQSAAQKGEAGKCQTPASAAETQRMNAAARPSRRSAARKEKREARSER